MQNYQKTEKIVSIISICSFAVGMISGILSLIYKVEFLDTIAMYGVTIFITPVLLVQVVMSANIHTYGIKTMGKVSWIFYLILFPSTDMWFFSGINALYHIVPNDDKLSSVVSWGYIGIIYLGLIGIGFLLRNFKKPSTTIVA